MAQQNERAGCELVEVTLVGHDQCFTELTPRERERERERGVQYM